MGTTKLILLDSLLQENQPNVRLRKAAFQGSVRG